MGLDAYVYFVKPEDVINDFDFKYEKYFDGPEDWYWRKYYAMNRFMERLWLKRTDGKVNDGDFNSAAIRLYPQDLDALELEVKGSSGGYSLEPIFETDEIIIYKKDHAVAEFYSDFDEMVQYQPEDLKFIQSCRNAIAEGRAVYYTADW